MEKIKVILIEDTEGYDFALNYEIGENLKKLGYDLTIVQRIDGNLIEQDLVTGCHILIVDYDLGVQTGDEIIETVNGFPEYLTLPIIFYSGGEPVESLKIKTRNYGNVRCSTKNDVGGILIDLIKSRF